MYISSVILCFKCSLLSFIYVYFECHPLFQVQPFVLYISLCLKHPFDIRILSEVELFGCVLVTASLQAWQLLF